MVEGGVSGSSSSPASQSAAAAEFLRMEADWEAGYLLTVRSAWSSLTLPSADGLRNHPPVTLRVLHRVDDPAVLTLPLGRS